MTEIQPNRKIGFLPAYTIAASGTTVSQEVPVPRDGHMLTLEAKFLYGAGGTSAKAYVQTSLDGGATWFDIASFAFATTAANKVSAVNRSIAPASQAFTPTDGTLTDNTIIQGVLGDRARVKLIVVGTYTGASSVELVGVFN